MDEQILYETNGFTLFKENVNCVKIKNDIHDNNCFVNTILHAFFYMPKLTDFLISDKFKAQSSFSSLLLELINLMKKYKMIHDTDSLSQSILDPTNFRSLLALEFKKSKLFEMNQQGDPVELLSILLNAFHSVAFDGCKTISENEAKCDPVCISHLLFKINLTEKKQCALCKHEITISYHSNYFIYEMYLQDVFDLISKKKLNSFNLISQNLFPLAKEAMSQVSLPCDKCKHDIFNKKLICNEIGHYFIVQSPFEMNTLSMSYLCLYYFLIPKFVSLDSIFTVEQKGLSKTFVLCGLILYWNKHYLSMFYEKPLKSYIVFDDTTVNAFSSWDELIQYLIKNLYYPIVLIYKEADSNENFSRTFKLTDDFCSELYKKCTEMDKSKQNMKVEEEIKSRGDNIWECEECKTINPYTVYKCKHCKKENLIMYQLITEMQRAKLNSKKEELEQKEIQKLKVPEVKDINKIIDYDNINRPAEGTLSKKQIKDTGKLSQIEPDKEDSKSSSVDEETMEIWACPKCSNRNRLIEKYCLGCRTKRPKEYDTEVQFHLEKAATITSSVKPAQLQSTQIAIEIPPSSSISKQKEDFPIKNKMAQSVMMDRNYSQNLIEKKMNVLIKNNKSIVRPNVKEDEWLCTICNKINNKKFDVCTTCRFLREELDDENKFLISGRSNINHYFK